MSAATFLVILAVVVLVLAGFIVKSWSELSNVDRHKRKKNQKDSK